MSDRHFVAALVCLLLAQPAIAGDPIEIDVGGGAIVAGGSSFVDLAEDLLRQEGAFTGLAGLSSYTVEVDYLGIPGAIELSASGFGSSVTVDIPSTGTSVVFSGASPDDVEAQIEDWLKQDGASEWAEFLQEVNARSPLALLDGNPRATTALMASSAFDKFGLRQGRSDPGRRWALERPGALELRLDAGGAFVDTQGFDDLYAVDGSLTLSGEPRKGLGLSLSVIGQYRSYDGAESYDLGLEFALPLTLRAPLVEALPIAWTLTPVVQAAAGASLDLAAGGLFLGGGLVNSLGARVGPIGLRVANEFLYYGGIPVEDVGGYDFETEVSQLVARTGVKALLHLSPMLSLDVGASLTNFLLDDAAVEVYGSPFIGATLELAFLQLRLGYEADVGEDYAAHNVELKLDCRF